MNFIRFNSITTVACLPFTFLAMNPCFDDGTGDSEISLANFARGGKRAGKKSTPLQREGGREGGRKGREGGHRGKLQREDYRQLGYQGDHLSPRVLASGPSTSHESSLSFDALVT